MKNRDSIVIFEDVIALPKKANSFQKLIKIGQYIQTYTNWSECLWLRKKVGQPTEEMRTVYFRSGIKMKVRVGTPDISILYEVFKSGAYASTEQLLKRANKPCSVIDLGANIGAFTLRCAIANPNVYVSSYEPGPQNSYVFRSSIELNPQLRDRIHLFQEAAARDTGIAYWHFDEVNPGGSILTILPKEKDIAVQTRSFQDILARAEYPIAFIKIDIEGSEYELLDNTNKQIWKPVPAVLVELHEDPSGKLTSEQWLKRMADFGFKHQKREHSSILLSR
jgi:FkbM family methyltransferase